MSTFFSLSIHSFPTYFSFSVQSSTLHIPYHFSTFHSAHSFSISRFSITTSLTSPIPPLSQSLTPSSFRNKNIALVTIINCMIYFCVALVFDGLNLAGDLYSDDPFLYLILGGLVEVPGILFAAPLIHHLGRKGPLVACLFGCGVVNVALSVLPAGE